MSRTALHTARTLARAAPARLAPAPARLHPALSSRPAAPVDPRRPYATATGDAAPQIAQDEKLMRAPFVLQQTGTALPSAALAAVVAAGLYYVLSPASRPVLSPDDEKKVQEHQVRHYLERCKQADAIAARHAAELDKEIAHLTTDHSSREDILQHRRACEERRARMKEHEQLLMKHRHDESFPNMRGKTQSYAEKERAAALDLTHQKDAMEALKRKLEAEGVKFSV